MVDGQQKQNFQRQTSSNCATNDNNKIIYFTKLSDTAVPTFLLIFFFIISTSIQNMDIFAAWTSY
jgi:hypothetical protein